MKFLNKIKIKQKILGSFIIVIILAAVLSVVSTVNIVTLDNQYTNNINSSLKDLTFNEQGILDFQEMRRNIRDLVIYAQQPDKYANANKNISDNYNSIKSTINDYKALLVETGRADTSTLDELMDNVDKYMTIHESINASILAGDISKAEELIDGEGKVHAENTQKLFNNAFNASITTTQSYSDNSSALTRQTILYIGVLALVILLVSLLLAIIIARNITTPIYKLVAGAKDMAAGKLNFSLAINNWDEIGELANCMGTVIEIVNRLITNIDNVIDEARNKGSLDARLDESLFNGSYRELVKGINVLMDDQANDNLDAIQCMREYAYGNFDVTVKRHIGEKAVMDEAWDQMQMNLKAFYKDISELVRAANDGQLEKRIDVSSYRNNWADMASGLNSVLNGVTTPLNEAINVVEAMSQGNMSVTMQGEYKGDYAKMKASINKTMTTIGGYIQEITYILTEMSGENFDLEIVNDYIGDFVPIKKALNEIIDVFNNILSEVNMSAEQVAAGARHISESSMSLAQGATEQASSVQELSSTIDTITEQTKQNADYAERVNMLAQTAKDSAAVGSSEMNALKNAMQEIISSSTNISRIIKVIDDIAFQTNLLALNAAIEAASAGKYGKGFAVVAAEVSALAKRSKDAASDTTSLIQSTIDKVSDGNRIANQTAHTLETIVSQITNITQLIGDVADSSKKQEEAIRQVNTGIDQISQVTQTNTATSEEEASSAQELSSQSEVFRNMVGKYKLKDASRVIKHVSSPVIAMSNSGLIDKNSLPERHVSNTSETIYEPEYKSEYEPITESVASKQTIKSKSFVSTPNVMSKTIDKPITRPVTGSVIKSSPVAATENTSIRKPVVSAKPVTAIKPVTVKQSATTAQTKTTIKPNAAVSPTLKPVAASKTAVKTVPTTGTIKPAILTTKNDPPQPARKSTLSIPEGSGASVYDRKDFGKY